MPILPPILSAFSHRSLCLDGLFVPVFPISAPALVLAQIPVVPLSVPAAGLGNCMRKSRKLQVAVPLYCCLNICKHKIPVKRQGHFSPGFGLQLSLQKECAFFLLLLCHKLYLSYRSLQPGWYPLKCHAIYGRDTVFTFWTANFTKSALYIVEVNTARFSSVTEQKKTAGRTVLDQITWTVIFMEGQVLNETVEVRVA